MGNAAIRIQNLGYSYPGQLRNCFTDLNLEINEGARFGLFGPNGAGKTTLMHCMTGLIRYTTGSIQLLGNEVATFRKSVNKLFAFVPQDFSLYHELSPVENLEFFGAWSGMTTPAIRKRTQELLEVLDLASVRNKPVQTFSGGMKRKVNLAIAVMNNPRILFLDEPTVGVDIQTRHVIINYLKELNRNGTTLVYTSHQLNEAEELCDTIAMIASGSIIAHNSLNNLLIEHKEDGLEGLFLRLTGKSYIDVDVI